MKARRSLLAQLETLLPLAVEWAAAEEQRALREGVPVSEQEMADAKWLEFANRNVFVCSESLLFQLPRIRS